MCEGQILEANIRMKHTSRFSLAPRSVISKGGGMRLLVELTLLLIVLFPLLVIPSFSLFLLLPPTLPFPLFLSGVTGGCPRGP
jgi:hypothetical protein